MIDLHPKCYLRIIFRVVSKESNVSPATIASNQNDFFHFLDSQSKPSGEGEPAINMFHDPVAKITLRRGVFVSSLRRER